LNNLKASGLWEFPVPIPLKKNFLYTYTPSTVATIGRSASSATIRPTLDRWRRSQDNLKVSKKTEPQQK
jgi:hypothetical protein